VLGGLEHAPDAVEAEVAVVVRDATLDDALDAGDGGADPVDQLLQRDLYRDVVA
jgi:hypothetical protein